MPRRRSRVTRATLAAVPLALAMPLAGAAAQAGRPGVVVTAFSHGLGTTAADAARFTHSLEQALAAESGVQWLSADSTARAGATPRYAVSGVVMVLGTPKLDWRVVDVASRQVVANGVRPLGSVQASDSAARALAGEIAALAARGTARP